jgi:hypothetical protein
MKGLLRGGTVLWLSLGLAPPSSAGETPDRSAGERWRVIVRVSNYAGATEDVLSRTEGVAERVLGHAGIPIEWRDCTVKRQRLPSNCSQHRGQGEIILDLLGSRQTRAFAKSPDPLGVALLPVGEGLYAAVFLDKAEALAGQASVPTSLVLGHAMAHEIGHLLLGTREHSLTGIMHSPWSSRDLWRAACGGLSFTAEESMRLRATVEGFWSSSGSPLPQTPTTGP